MTGKYASPIDDLLAENRKQMDDVLGGTSGARLTQTETLPAATVTAATVSEPQPVAAGVKTDAKTVAGTANGVPFRLTV